MMCSTRSNRTLSICPEYSNDDASYIGLLLHWLSKSSFSPQQTDNNLSSPGRWRMCVWCGSESPCFHAYRRVVLLFAQKIYCSQLIHEIGRSQSSLAFSPGRRRVCKKNIILSQFWPSKQAPGRPKFCCVV